MSAEAAGSSRKPTRPETASRGTAQAPSSAGKRNEGLPRLRFFRFFSRMTPRFVTRNTLGPPRRRAMRSAYGRRTGCFVTDRPKRSSAPRGSVLNRSRTRIGTRERAARTANADRMISKVLVILRGCSKQFCRRGGNLPPAQQLDDKTPEHTVHEALTPHQSSSPFGPFRKPTQGSPPARSLRRRFS